MPIAAAAGARPLVLWIWLALLAAPSALPGAAWAETRDPAAQAQAQAKAERDRLFERLAKSTTEAEGREIERQIWLSWFRGPTEEITALVKRSQERREAADFDAALAILDKVVAMAPDYAEGWNQRAFVYFLKADYGRSLDDIERTLQLEPRHFGALSGKATILMRQGRIKLAQEVLREALAIDPWLRERALLTAPSGRDL